MLERIFRHFPDWLVNLLASDDDKPSMRPSLGHLAWFFILVIFGIMGML